MRRKDKEITEKSALEAIIRKALVCRLGLIDGNRPYVVPLCFGYREEAIYIHGALQGKKMEALRKNGNVCVEFDIDTEIIPSDSACDWGMRFQSVIGFGRAVFLEDRNEKQKALDAIMAHYADPSFAFPDKTLEATAVIKIEIQSMTGKQSGF